MLTMHAVHLGYLILCDLYYRVTWKRTGWDSNPRPFGLQANAVLLCHTEMPCICVLMREQWTLISDMQLWQSHTVPVTCLDAATPCIKTFHKALLIIAGAGGLMHPRNIFWHYLDYLCVCLRYHLYPFASCNLLHFYCFCFLVLNLFTWE